MFNDINNHPSADSGAFEQSIAAIPSFLGETLLIGVLVLLTLFRRRLSSNDTYREMNQLESTDDDVDDIISSSTAATDEGSNSLSNLTVGRKVDKVELTDATRNKLKHDLSLEANTDSFYTNGLDLWKHPSFSRLYDFAQNTIVNHDYGNTANSLQSFIMSGKLKFRGLSVSIDKMQSNDSALRGKIGKSQDNLSALSPDLLLCIITYLSLSDIGPLSSLSRGLAKDVKSDFIWEQLWLQNYSQMWHSTEIRRLRDRRNIQWSPLEPKDQNGKERGSSYTPPQGWFRFYLEFEACWLNWLLAGLCTTDLCVLGLGGSIFDITAFLPIHPGSLETLSDACGGDGTEQFADIGHSSDAVELSRKYLIATMPEHLTCGQYQHLSKLNRYRGSRPGHLINFQLSFKKQQQRIEEEAYFLRRCNRVAPVDETKKLNPSVGGFFDCKDKPHFGRPKACYDPLEQIWTCWWTCCGTYHINGVNRR